MRTSPKTSKNIKTQISNIFFPTKITQKAYFSIFKNRNVCYIMFSNSKFYQKIIRVVLFLLIPVGEKGRGCVLRYFGTVSWMISWFLSLWSVAVRFLWTAHSRIRAEICNKRSLNHETKIFSDRCDEFLLQLRLLWTLTLSSGLRWIR